MSTVTWQPTCTFERGDSVPKPRISAVILLLLMINCLAVTVYAHSGKTDENGGHTDHDTGEYHYHHGYPAHQHYDIDGDGTIDCPYDFDDNTKETSGGKSTGINNNPWYQATQMHPTVSQASNKPLFLERNTDPEVSAEDEAAVPTWIYWLTGGLTVVVICLLVSNNSKKEEIRSMKSQHKYELDMVRKICNNKLAEKKATEDELQAIRLSIANAKTEKQELSLKIEDEAGKLAQIRNQRSVVKHAPLDISFADDGMPIYWRPSMMKPYGDYTVYISPKSGIYHTDRVCASYRASEDHIFNVISSLRPCKKCAEGFYEFTTVPDWFVQKGQDESE